jgi:hypothetical protein
MKRLKRTAVPIFYLNIIALLMLLLITACGYEAYQYQHTFMRMSAVEEENTELRNINDEYAAKVDKLYHDVSILTDKVNKLTETDAKVKSLIHGE